MLAGVLCIPTCPAPWGEPRLAGAPSISMRRGLDAVLRPKVREHHEVPVRAGVGTWAKDRSLGDVVAHTSHPSDRSEVKDRTVVIKRFTGVG